MRYSISNAIPHKPKSEKHPYENLVNTAFAGFGYTFLYRKPEQRILLLDHVNLEKIVYRMKSALYLCIFNNPSSYGSFAAAASSSKTITFGCSCKAEEATCSVTEPQSVL